MKALVGLHQQSMWEDEDPLTIDEALIIQVRIHLLTKQLAWSHSPIMIDLISLKK